MQRHRAGKLILHPTPCVAVTAIREHARKVVFAGQSERIEVSHKAESREIFANGAIKAALWAHDQKPGLYSMTDVLGIDDLKN